MKRMRILLLGFLFVASNCVGDDLKTFIPKDTKDLIDTVGGNRVLMREKDTENYICYDPADGRKLVVVKNPEQAGRFRIRPKDGKAFIEATIRLDGDDRRRLNVDSSSVAYFKNRNMEKDEQLVWEDGTFKNPPNQKYMYISDNRVKITKDKNRALKFEFIFEKDIPKDVNETTKELYERLKGKEFYIKMPQGYWLHGHDYRPENENVLFTHEIGKASRFTLDTKDGYIFITARKKVDGEVGRRLQQWDASDKNPSSDVIFHNKNMKEHERWKLVGKV